MKNLLKIIFIILFVVTLSGLFMYLGNKQNNNLGDGFLPAGLNFMEKRLLDKCQVPTLSSDKCFFTEFQECPKYNGSYLQCTNNYIPKPNQNNCKCHNRAFELCPSPFKISEKCYYENLKIE